MICLSLVDLSFAEILAVAARAELIELRLDRLQVSSAELYTILQTAASTIVCYPGNLENREARFAILRAAIGFGATYIDCAAIDKCPAQKDLIEHAREQGTKIVYSFHNNEFTPPLEQLREMVELAFSENAEICKIATLAHTQMDVLNLLSLYCYAPRMIALGMGEFASFTRIAALELGAPFSYAALSDAHKAAPGQMTEAAMRKALELIRDAD